MKCCADDIRKVGLLAASMVFLTAMHGHADITLQPPKVIAVEAVPGQREAFHITAEIPYTSLDQIPSECKGARAYLIYQFELGERPPGTRSLFQERFRVLGYPDLPDKQLDKVMEFTLHGSHLTPYIGEGRHSMVSFSRTDSDIDHVDCDSGEGAEFFFDVIAEPDPPEPSYCPVTPQAPCQMSVGGAGSANVRGLQHPDEEECEDCKPKCERQRERVETGLASVIGAFFQVLKRDGEYWSFSNECIAENKPDGSSFRAAADAPTSLEYSMESSDPNVLHVTNGPDTITLEKKRSGDVTLWVTASENNEPVARLAWLVSVPDVAVPVLPLPAIFLLGAGLATMAAVRLQRRRL